MAFGNRFAGALAALSAAAWFDFFHTEPYQSFHIQDGADVETAVLLLVVGLIVSQLAAHARMMKRVAVTDATHLERLHGTTRLARSATSSDDVGLVAADLAAQAASVLDDGAVGAAPRP
ncbi:DUF4118 domain-containing protein [Streptomyces tanashiensis]|uniref:DUF4118 domain-containing protein n=1 Tax=Streptomyces tanashiensis TaxID=67367 RepID=UPI00369D07F3